MFYIQFLHFIELFGVKKNPYKRQCFVMSQWAVMALSGRWQHGQADFGSALFLSLSEHGEGLNKVLAAG